MNNKIYIYIKHWLKIRFNLNFDWIIYNFLVWYEINKINLLTIITMHINPKKQFILNKEHCKSKLDVTYKIHSHNCINEIEYENTDNKINNMYDKEEENRSEFKFDYIINLT